ncbi:MAG TPA: efflux RND transporter periplasmic adaptor subunit [Gemmatimonadaceae bacterium]|jgi:multidrug efflux system membrane fusion protein|nr:efflux RND transporter periplasmic adaptor subunit [Gemmatimonadaceae bacterium]
MTISRPDSRSWQRAAALLTLCAAAACSAKKPDHETAVPVRVAAASRGDAAYTITANGVVEPLQTVSVQSQVGGTLTEVAFHEGDEVTAGQVLFRIDARPFENALRQAQAQLTRDLAQAQSAQRDADRYRALVAKDYVTQSQADQAEANAAALRATVQADSAAVENARVNLGYTVIRAPIGGRTGSLLLRPGNLVHANSEALVVINQIHPILVRFPVTQRDFIALKQHSLSEALPVRVTTADSSQVAEAGTLTFLDNAVDSLTGTVTAKARFENAGRVLWPGEYVRVTVQLGVQHDALLVPSAAVMTGQQGAYVFIVDSARTARVRQVLPGRIVGPLTVVDSGLVAGERVVVDGQSRLVSGAVVDVVGSGTTPAGSGS